ncbi:hypothetical protein LPJ56_005700, partial [Coemansia sp. RSA 2599]
SDQNKAVYDVLRDCLRSCIKSHRPRARAWLDKLSRIDPGIDGSVPEMLGEAKDVVDRIADSVAKCQDLGIDLGFLEAADDNIEESEDEFEDVTEETAAQVSRRLRSMKGRLAVPGSGSGSGDAENASSNKSSHCGKQNDVFSLLHDPAVKKDPTYMDSRRLHELRQAMAPPPLPEDSLPSNPVEDRLREIAPVVEFGPDLLYWSEDSVPVDTSGLEIRHRFLGAARDQPTVSGQTLDRLRMRAVPYDSLVAQSQAGAAGRPAIKACRAPMKNGKLCPRRDLVKCPFHGPVIPRDEQGHPAGGYVQEEQPSEEQSEASERDTARVNTVATAEKISDLGWQDLDALQRAKEERERQQGRQQKRGRKRKEAPQSALVKINKKQTNARDRLKKALRSHAK